MRDSSEIWTGEASKYDRTRPTPPPALLDLLTQLIHTPHPTLVVGRLLCLAGARFSRTRVLSKLKRHLVSMAIKQVVDCGRCRQAL